MADAFTKRNHYNPCFWTALWNRDYFENWSAGREVAGTAREQSVFTLNLRADRIFPTNVENVHFEKNLGVAEITPEAMKRFCQRWHPQEYERLSEYLAAHPETLFLDFEDILAGIEGMRTYSSMMRAAEIGGVESAQHKGFLVCALIIHAMRGHEFMTNMLENASFKGLEKWEYFWLLKNAWSNHLILARAVTPLAFGEWTLWRTRDHQFPLCDSPVMIDRDSLMAILSPRLLLEINLTVPRPEEHWILQDGISSSKYDEFRNRAIANTFKDILFHDRTALEEWRVLPQCRKRVDQLSDPFLTAHCVNEVASRIIWALSGFGRVPDDFERHLG